MRQRSKQNINVLLFVKATILFVAVLLFISACSAHKRETPIDEAKQLEWTDPKITLLSQLSEKNKPRIVLLDTVLKPVVVNVNFENKAGVKSTKLSNKRGKTIVNEAAGIGLFTTYTTDEGLGLDQVYCSYKDKWGNLWFGTNGGGVSKYDGKDFTTYTTAHGLASNVIWCITQDHEDNLWFGTDGSGVSRWDGESFTNFTKAEGLADDVVFCTIEDTKQNLWFGTLKGGVSKWDGKKFTNYSMEQGLGNNAVKAIAEDGKGNIWFGTLGGGASKWDGKGFFNYTTDDGLVGNKIWSIMEDSSGCIWFGSGGKGLSKYDGDSFKNYIVLDESSNDVVSCLANDKQGRIWIGTQKTGVISYDGKNFVGYSTENGLANNQIRAITQDEKGNLWFSSFGSGVCKFAGNSFTNFTAAQGLASNVIYSIEEDANSNLWFGTSGGGASRYDGQNFINLTQEDGLPRNEVYCVYEDRAGNLWYGTSGGGVTKYNGRSFTTYRIEQGLSNNIVFSVLEDKTGNMWFGTSGGGVCKFDGKAFTHYTTLQGLAGDVVFSIKEDRNANLWFSTLGGGVSKFDGNGFTNYTLEQGLLDNVVWTVTEDRENNLWFGTQHGLSMMQPQIQTSGAGNSTPNTLRQMFTSFTTEDGLPNNFVTQVIQGDGQKLYVGTNLGMCELIPAKHHNAGGKNWVVGKVYNTRNGYPVKDINAGLNALFKDSKGVIWMGTGSDKTGLVRFEPSSVTVEENKALKLFINKVRLNNEPVCWRNIGPVDYNRIVSNAETKTAIAEEVLIYGRKLSQYERDSLHERFAGIRFTSVRKWQALPEKLVLPYYFNNVSFDFGAVETGKNFLIKYTHFLEGYDKDWSPPSSGTTANFGNISEGSYTFMVKAQSPEGVWGQPIFYNFTVLPPWWRTWWMYTLYAIFLIGLIILFSWWKHKRIIYQKKILEYKVKMATKQLKEENMKVEAHKKQIENTLNELKETQAQLIQSEKMASLGELTAGIAHEIQNPLNFINNFSEVSNELIAEMNEEWKAGNIDEAKSIATDIRQNLEKINHHGKRADAIVKGMLQHSRSSSGVKEPTDINRLTDEYVRLAYHGLRAKNKSFNAIIQTNYGQDVGSLNIIPHDMGRVILNLVTNAFYAVNQKAIEAEASGKTEYKPSVSITTKRAGDTVAIVVADNGNGIPTNILNKIFQPFFTTKPAGQGTGLGLGMSYDIVTKVHHGKLEVASKEGEGASFTIYLKQ